MEKQSVSSTTTRDRSDFCITTTCKMVITRNPAIDISPANGNDLDMFHKGSKLNCGPTTLLIKGMTLTTIGILLIIWTPYQLMMDERLRLHKGLPPYDWWEIPPELIYMRVRIFNYTNVDKYLAGIDEKLQVEEVGPLIYKEILTHKNITFNENSTITYVANHTAQYMPELNTLSLNDTIIVPNYALLLMATYLHNAPFFAKLGFNLLVRRHKTKMFMKMSIQDFFWNFTDPILDLSNKLIPSIVPVNNIGMLHRVYENFEDKVTMYMGTKHGHERFSLINKFGGSSHLPNYKNCDDVLTNATEGVTYNQLLTRNSVLRYWRKTICKVVELIYDKDVVHTGVNAYKYVVPPHTYDRTEPEYNDCYKGFPTLLNGLSDVSNCMFGVPIAASFPHFISADQKLKEYVSGLKPDNEKHESFVIAEPITGIPLESMARSQSNLVMRKLVGFTPNITKFSDMALPMFWLEYHQVGIPFKVSILVYFMSVIIEPFQIILTIALFTIGFLYVIRFGRQVTQSRAYQHIFMPNRNILEQEHFLKPHRITVTS